MINKFDLMKKLETHHEDGVNMAEASKVAKKASTMEEAVSLYEEVMAKKSGKVPPELQAWDKWKNLHMQAEDIACERARIGEMSSDKVFELIEKAEDGMDMTYEVSLTKAIRDLKEAAAQYEELAKKWCESMRQPWPVWPWC